jgi:MFS family permease
VIFVGLLTIAIFPMFLPLLVGMMLIGGGVGVVFPVTIDIVSRNFPDERATTAVASYETAINIGGTVGPYIFGMLTVITTIGRSFLLMSIFGIFMALLRLTEQLKQENDFVRCRHVRAGVQIWPSLISVCSTTSLGVVP